MALRRTLATGVGDAVEFGNHLTWQFEAGSRK